MTNTTALPSTMVGFVVEYKKGKEMPLLIA